MGALTNNKGHIEGHTLPRLLPSHLINTQWLNHNATISQYNVSGTRFSALGTQATLNELKEHLIEIDIQTELSLLTEDSLLEVTVPVCGLNDLLKEDGGSHFLNFPIVVNINGFGAKNEDVLNDNFPRADYIRMTDIVGNQFEILVDSQGKIELPEQGAGLFSIPQSLTFIYNAQQVLNGAGLQEMTAVGMNKNKMYLLPPSQSKDSFSPYICVTHLNHNNRRMVDSIRRISVSYDDVPLKILQQKSSANRYEKDISELLYVDVLLSTSHKEVNDGFSVSVTLEPIDGVAYSFKHLMKSTLPIESHGWKQHPILSHVYTKQFGLSQNALQQLIHCVYSEYDFMKDYLQGDTFNLSVNNGYNQFLVHHEAFEKCYDLLVHDLISRKMTGDFLIDRIADDRLIELDVSDFNVDFHDSIVLAELKESFATFEFDEFHKLFLAPQSISHEFQVSDYFYVYAQGIPEDKLPKVALNITQGQTFSRNLVNSIEANLEENRAEEKVAQLQPTVTPSTKSAPGEFDQENFKFKPPHERREYTPSQENDNRADSKRTAKRDKDKSLPKKNHPNQTPKRPSHH